MKRSAVLTLLPVFLLAGSAIAVDLSGEWTADNYCVPNDDLPDPTTPKYEESTMVITQNGNFFVVEGITPNPGEICGGVIDGEIIHLTCPGTIFHGEVQGNKKKLTIVGINHNPEDGATCTVEAEREKD